MAILKNDWAPVLEGEFAKPYYTALRQFLVQEYRTQTVYPEPADIYNALHFTPYSATKVVIIGQDPYHGPGQAHGLSFSVKPGVEIPPSLQNIFKELHHDLGCPKPAAGCLNRWAEQGVLLLNTVLTVRQGSPNSHRGKGWEAFTDQVIAALNRRAKPVVFILWGNGARAKVSQIDTARHRVIESPHPSPLSASRGFFGSRPFSRANRYLSELGEREIDWNLNAAEG